MPKVDKREYRPKAKLVYLQNGTGDYNVYMHIFPNGKKYIGITSCRLNERWRDGKGYDQQPYMANAIKKYGWDNVQHILLCEKLSMGDAAVIERIMIATFETNNSLNGYNIDNGGFTSGRHSESARRKMSESHKGKIVGRSNPFYGVHQIGEQNPFYGHKHTEETLNKMRENHVAISGSKHHYAKSVICNGVEFETIGECAVYLGIDRVSLSQYLLGKRKCIKKLNGYDIKYKDGDLIEQRNQNIAV